MRCLCSIFNRAMLSHVLGILPQETTLQIETRPRRDPKESWREETHRSFYTHRGFSTPSRLFYKPLLQGAFAHKRLGAFTHRSFYTKKSLHREAFTHWSFYTQKRLHTASFYTHRGFYTEKTLHRGAFYTQKVLHREVFTLRSFCTQTSWSF